MSTVLYTVGPTLAIPGSICPGRISTTLTFAPPFCFTLNLISSPVAFCITPSLSFSIKSFKSRPAPIAAPASVWKLTSSVNTVGAPGLAVT
jgi:hypothetical protein